MLLGRQAIVALLAFGPAVARPRTGLLGGVHDTGVATLHAPGKPLFARTWYVQL